MGKFQPLAISYANNGLVKNKNAFVLTDDAFQKLENAYTWRGRIKRRQGNELMGRLQVAVTAQAFASTPTLGAGSNAVTITQVLGADFAESSFVPGSGASSLIFVIGAQTLTDSTGTGTFSIAPAGDITNAIINYSSGTLTLTCTAGGTPASTFTGSYYPNLPVMGLFQRDTDIVDQEDLIAFDTRFSYTYTQSSKLFSRIGSTEWSGTNYQFFDSLNYLRDSSSKKLLWVTNHNPADPIRYYNGTSWTDFTPALDSSGAPTYLMTAKLLVANRGRMIAFNTKEGATRGATIHYPNRARVSWVGDATNSESFYSDIAGHGFYIDCPVYEEITDYEFVKDQLIVIFERSTWRFRYTGSELQPYVWERINRERGGKFQTVVPFDQRIAFVGDKSLNYCDGVTVESFNDPIPDQAFEMSLENHGVNRIHGARDFQKRLVYWTYPSYEANGEFPDRLVVFNYEAESFSIFKDSITRFGVFQNQNYRTWAELSGTKWGDANFPWNDIRGATGFTWVIGGNQQGFVFKIGEKESDDGLLYLRSVTVSSSSTNLEIIDHNLEQNEWITISGVIGTGYASLVEGIFQIDIVDTDNVEINAPPEASITAISNEAQALITSDLDVAVGDRVYFRGINGVSDGSVTSTMNSHVYTVTAIDQEAGTFTIDLDTSSLTSYSSGGIASNISRPVQPYITASATYSGGGLIHRVHNFNVRSKKFNILQEGRKQFLGHIDFLAETNENGGFNCNIYTDYNDSTAVNDGSDSFFNNVVALDPIDIGNVEKTKDWFRFYCPTDAQFFEFELTFNDALMADIDKAQRTDVEIDAFVIYSEGGGRLAE